MLMRTLGTVPPTSLSGWEALDLADAVVCIGAIVVGLLALALCSSALALAGGVLLLRD
jgi:hypothetical protein